MEAFPPGVHGSPINPLVGAVPDRRRPLHLLRHDAADEVLGRRVQAHGPRRLADDPRFATVESIAENTAAAVEILTRGDGQADAAPSGASGSRRWLGPWAPVQDTLQAVEDAQIRANEYLVQAGELELVANPVQFDVSAPQTGPAPGFAEQTDEILLELGLDWDRIIELKTAGAVT